jgi:hypothetical protein
VSSEIKDQFTMGRKWNDIRMPKVKKSGAPERVLKKINRNSVMSG